MPLEPDVPPISSVAFRLFARSVRGSFRRHFRAVMAQNAERLENARPPLIVFSNHASWWDPALCVLLGRLLMPNAQHFVPVPPATLRRFPEKAGFFPADSSSSRGAADFLRTAEAILRDRGVLWMTPQGRSADVREFPVAFRPALGALAARVPEATLLPLAAEYTFWDERLPRVLLRCGEPLQTSPETAPETLSRDLESALAATMLTLQRASCARDAASFRTLEEGRRRLGALGGLFGKFAGVRE